MMLSTFNVVGLLLILVATSYLFKSWSERARFQQAAEQIGCKEGTRVPTWDRLFGIDLFVSTIKAEIAGHKSDAFRILHKAYGQTFEMKALGPVQIQTSQPENIQAVCTSAFDDWGVEPMRGNIGAPFLDRGIFTDDGPFWKHSRGLIRSTFSRTEIADLENFERYVQRFLALVPRDRTTFDLLPLVKRLFLDTSTEFLFGQSTNSLELGDTDTDEFSQAFDRSLLGLALLLILGPVRWPLYLDPTWKAAYTRVHDFVDQRVQSALARQRSSQSTDPKSKRGKYILLDEMAAVIQDPYELRMQIINVFFPARDTAAIAFGDIIFELARHPEEWGKLRAEVSALGAQSLTFELVKSLKRTKAIINESLRLHPAASRIGRCSLKDTVLPKGGGPDGESPLFVPRGRVIELDLYCVQRDIDIWGPDADEFKPDRWSDGRPLWESKWQYQPFLGGIRMCPAQNQVLTQLAYLLVRFAQEFKVMENRDPVYEYCEKVTMTVESKNGVKIALQRATLPTVRKSDRC